MGFIINKQTINKLLLDAQTNVTEELIMQILKKAEKLQRLSDYDAALLLYAPDCLQDNILETAINVNNKVHGKQRFFYGVSYVSDFCISTCRYCGDNVLSSRQAARTTLCSKKLEADIMAILQANINIPEICLLSGDNPCITIDKWIDYIRTIFNVYSNELTLNVAPFCLDEFKMIRNSFPSNKLQFRVFQETYDIGVYEREHPHYKDIAAEFPIETQLFLDKRGIDTPPKCDFTKRLNSQSNAIMAGFDNYGLGVLYGLNDIGHKSLFEVIAQKQHGDYMYNTYDKWPKTISFPRIQPSLGVLTSPYVDGILSDAVFERIIAVNRMIFPYSHLVNTCRESESLRRKLRPLINIEDFAARPGPGGNISDSVDFQMDIKDKRSGIDVKSSIESEGYEII